MPEFYEGVNARVRDGAEEEMLSRRPALEPGVRQKLPGLLDIHLVCLDDGTYLDVLRWESRRPRTPPPSCSPRPRRPARSTTSSRRVWPTIAARSRRADGGEFDGGRGRARRALALLVVSRSAGVHRVPRQRLGPPHARRP